MSSRAVVKTNKLDSSSKSSSSLKSKLKSHINSTLKLEKSKDSDEDSNEESEKKNSNSENEDSENEDSVNEDSENEDSVNEDSENEDSENEDSENEDSVNEESENEDSVNEESENEDSVNEESEEIKSKGTKVGNYVIKVPEKIKSKGTKVDNSVDNKKDTYPNPYKDKSNLDPCTGRYIPPPSERINKRFLGDLSTDPYDNLLFYKSKDDSPRINYIRSSFTEEEADQYIKDKYTKEQLSKIDYDILFGETQQTYIMYLNKVRQLAKFCDKYEIDEIKIDCYQYLIEGQINKLLFCKQIYKALIYEIDKKVINMICPGSKYYKADGY